MRESNSTPPAPLDLGRLEAEAIDNAAKHVSSRFQVIMYFLNKVLKMKRIIF